MPGKHLVTMEHPLQLSPEYSSEPDRYGLCNNCQRHPFLSWMHPSSLELLSAYLELRCHPVPELQAYHPEGFLGYAQTQYGVRELSPTLSQLVIPVSGPLMEWFEACPTGCCRGVCWLIRQVFSDSLCTCSLPTLPGITS